MTVASAPSRRKANAGIEGHEDVIRRILHREMPVASLKSAVVKKHDHDLFAAAI
ncbi:MAG: hypothetical protein QF577_02060 [Phycisphaerae bacterium]|jgi:hypothetical protein|nr:hypothetical protein [Phycisphaerae bacterium]MDP7636312.1 hypothetical protein [Phycisphaerae bacterium]